MHDWIVLVSLYTNKSYYKKIFGTVNSPSQHGLLPLKITVSSLVRAQSLANWLLFFFLPFRGLQLHYSWISSFRVSVVPLFFYNEETMPLVFNYTLRTVGKKILHMITLPLAFMWNGQLAKFAGFLVDISNMHF